MTDRLDHVPAMPPAAGPASVRQPEVAGAFYPADVAPDHWSDGLRVSRFTAESFGGPFHAG